MLSLRRYFRPSDASGLSTTIASPTSAPFLVPPKLSTSTPASRVKARSGRPRAAAAFEMRAPSMCSCMPRSWAWSAIARISSTVYAVPSSVVCVIETTSGCARCSSPQPHASWSMSSGVSLPSGLRTVRSFMPPTRSGAPPSSVLMCAVDAADDRAPAGEHRLQAGDVRAGAVEDGEGLDALAEVLREDLLQALGVDVLAVGDLVAAVGGGDRGEDLGVHAGVVVGGEAADGGVVELIGHRTILASGACGRRTRRMPRARGPGAGRAGVNGVADDETRRAATPLRPHMHEVCRVARPRAIGTCMSPVRPAVPPTRTATRELKHSERRDPAPVGRRRALIRSTAQCEPRANRRMREQQRAAQEQESRRARGPPCPHPCGRAIPTFPSRSRPTPTPWIRRHPSCPGAPGASGRSGRPGRGSIGSVGSVGSVGSRRVGRVGRVGRNDRWSSDRPSRCPRSPRRRCRRS